MPDLSNGSLEDEITTVNIIALVIKFEIHFIALHKSFRHVKQ
jgi:hypothetical protein